MIRRMLLAALLVAAPTSLALDVAQAAPASTQCPSTGGTKVLAVDSPSTVTVTDTRTGTPVDVVVTITGTTFAITAPTGATYTLETASWCVKSSLTTTDPSAGSGLTGTSPSVNKKGVLQNISYVTVYSVTTTAPIPTCLDGLQTFGVDSWDIAVGAPNSTGYDAEYRTSTDGSCTGSASTVYDVRIFTVTNAYDLCVNVLHGGIFSISLLYTPAPAGWTGCTLAKV